MSNVKHFPLISRSKNTALKQPKEISSFSRNIEGEYLQDDSSLSYYYLPDSDVGQDQIDLSAGFKDFIQFDPERDGEFTGLLKCIENYERSMDSKLKVDIISWRGIMTKLLILPYENRNEIDLNIIRFDGQIFIQSDKKLDLKRQEEEKASQTDQLKKLTFSGYKFEVASTLSQPWAQSTRKEIETRRKRKVNNIEQYCSVVKTGIGKVKYCIGGEVDCVWDYKPSKEEELETNDDPLTHYVELKTSRILDQPGQVFNFEKKLFKTWAQCFLIGIRKVIYGFRDDNLILRSVEEYKTDEIPLLFKQNPLNQQQQQQQHQKNPAKKAKHLNKCMDSLKFFGSLLEFIVDNIPDDETKAWRLSYHPNSNKDYLHLTQLDVLEANELLNGENSILTSDFKNWRKELKEKINSTSN
ncbi:hypothetical protein PACTADRAFT_37484 [Pachysolen tannophilus NRRL Y-2460]|uniref:Decapping nuclease n=1 Tax=Pachysolen tannophilus NRRL Y-2460 TaxID=669874 RepID=A0A1E4U2Y2_PACTA|nr:hypothetical protein PACTADRAFT_37484 [Pachysolen tannophilus NRRL Y-2460]